MRAYTLEEFDKNIDRVRNLIAVYEVLRSPGAGRRTAKAADTLRAAVVFLHSALEEVIRNTFLWKLPLADSAVLDSIPLVGLSPSGRPEKFFLGKLAPHRGLFVDNVIRDSIDAYVDRMNINDTTEIARCLEMIGLVPTKFATNFPKLQAMMNRRHQIVHQMDRNPQSGTGRHRTQSISTQQVRDWSNNLVEFVYAIVADLPD
jgi:RiboL-PSP-HEPN